MKVKRRKLPPQLAKVLETANSKEMVSELISSNEKLAKLQAMLTQLCIRSPQQVEDEISSEINILDKISNDINLIFYVESKYSPEYFRKDPDTEFKVALAESLLDYMHGRVSGYSNDMLLGIASNSNEYYDLVKNFIVED